MAAPSKRIQVIADENVFHVLSEMGKKGLRGKTTSEVAYTILDEWVWHNQEKIVANGISLRRKKAVK